MQTCPRLPKRFARPEWLFFLLLVPYVPVQSAPTPAGKSEPDPQKDITVREDRLDADLRKIIARKQTESTGLTFDITWPLLPIPDNTVAAKESFHVKGTELAAAARDFSHGSLSDIAGYIKSEPSLVALPVQHARLLQIRQVEYSRAEVFALLFSKGLRFEISANGKLIKSSNPEDIDILFEPMTLAETGAHLWRVTATASLNTGPFHMPSRQDVDFTVNGIVQGANDVSLASGHIKVKGSDIKLNDPQLEGALSSTETLNGIVQNFDSEYFGGGSNRLLSLFFPAAGTGTSSLGLGQTLDRYLELSDVATGYFTGHGSGALIGLNGKLLPEESFSPPFVVGLSTKGGTSPVFGIGAPPLRGKLGKYIEPLFVGVHRSKDADGSHHSHAVVGLTLPLGGNPKNAPKVLRLPPEVYQSE